MNRRDGGEGIDCQGGVRAIAQGEQTAEVASPPVTRIAAALAQIVHDPGHRHNDQRAGQHWRQQKHQAWLYAHHQQRVSPGGRVQRAGMLHGRQRAPHGQRLCPHQSWPSVYHTSSPTSVVTICPPMMLRGCASGESGRPNASTQLAPKGAISQTAPEACDSHAVMAIASPAPHNDTRVKGSDGAGGALDASLSLTRMMQPLAEWKTPQGY